jgi:hypothetical protein
MVIARLEESMSTDEGIRQIFMHPRVSYALQETATLLGYSHEELLTAIDRGDLAIEATADIPRIAWEELAFAAVERWPQEVIEAALGDDLPSAIPELVTLTNLHARVPGYGVLVLRRLAKRAGTTIDDILARQIRDLAATEAESFDLSIAGLDAAIRWPLR